MKRMCASTLLVLALGSSLVACGGEKPKPRTEPAATIAHYGHGAQRVFEDYRQSGDVKKVVTVNAGTKVGFIRMDCVGIHGDLSVTITSLGGTSVGCSTKKGKGKGRVILSGDENLPANLTITVTSDSRNTWSVAIDTGGPLESS
jgi:hypothetical protein